MSSYINSENIIDIPSSKNEIDIYNITLAAMFSGFDAILGRIEYLVDGRVVLPENVLDYQDTYGCEATRIIANFHSSLFLLHCYKKEFECWEQPQALIDKVDKYIKSFLVYEDFVKECMEILSKSKLTKSITNSSYNRV